jgi:transposase-like protein
VRVFGVVLHTIDLSLREILALLKCLGVERSHSGVWNWSYRLSKTQAGPPAVAPSRVAAETQSKVGGEEKWLYVVIDTDWKLLLEVDVYSRCETNPAAAFLHRLTEKHNVGDASFSLVWWVSDGHGWSRARQSPRVQHPKQQ